MRQARLRQKVGDRRGHVLIAQHADVDGFQGQV